MSDLHDLTPEDRLALSRIQLAAVIKQPLFFALLGYAKRKLIRMTHPEIKKVGGSD